MPRPNFVPTRCTCMNESLVSDSMTDVVKSWFQTILAFCNELGSDWDDCCCVVGVAKVNGRRTMSIKIGYGKYREGLPLYIAGKRTSHRCL